MSIETNGLVDLLHKRLTLASELEQRHAAALDCTDVTAALSQVDAHIDAVFDHTACGKRSGVRLGASLLDAPRHALLSVPLDSDEASVTDSLPHGEPTKASSTANSLGQIRSNNESAPVSQQWSAKAILAMKSHPLR